MSEQKIFGLGSSHCKTEYSMKEYLFSWSLKNFSDLWPITKEKSEEFEIKSGLYFHAELHVKDKECLFYVESRIDRNEKRIFVEVFVTDCKEQVLCKKSKLHLYTDNAPWALFTFSREDLQKFSKSAPYNLIVFKCVMKFGKYHTHPVLNQASVVSDNLTRLVDDFKNLYINAHCSDFSLLLEGNVLRAHKSVLSARSPVFAKMLESPMEEAKNDTLDIKDIKLPIMKEFMEFLYTGNLPSKDFENVCDLYYVADKYDVSSLRQTCIEILMEKMNVDNVCCVLSLASRHSDNEFKDFVVGAIKFNFDTILETDSWKELVKKETELASEVMLICRGSKRTS